MSCENCKWSVPYPRPAVEKPKPVPDTWIERWFGDGPDVGALIRWHRYESLVECQRFPKREMMRKSETCGEFEEQQNATD